MRGESKHDYQEQDKSEETSHAEILHQEPRGPLIGNRLTAADLLGQ